jgi:hypothetical protein
MMDREKLTSLKEGFWKINEDKFYLILEYSKEKQQYRFSLTDGRASAWTDEVGITQELRKIGYEGEVDNFLADAKSGLVGKQSALTVDSEILRKSGISFK